MKVGKSIQLKQNFKTIFFTLTAFVVPVILDVKKLRNFDTINTSIFCDEEFL